MMLSQFVETLSESVQAMVNRVRQEREEEVEALREELAEERHQRQVRETENKIDLAAQQKEHLQQLSEVIGENFALLSENAQLQAQLRAAELARVESESEAEELRAAVASLTESNDALLAEGAALGLQVKGLLWDLQQAQSGAVDSRERRECPRCGSDLDWRRSRTFCLRCEEVTEPSPLRDG